MTTIEFKTCPVCDGSRTRTITKYEGLRSSIVKIPCTACGGKGKIHFVDLTKSKQEENEEKSLNISDLPEGWRRSSGWSMIHFIKNGKSLCGGVRSKDSISKSKPADSSGSKASCPICEKRLV